MSKRIYQLTALAILIGAPILVNMISPALPGAQPAVETVSEPVAEERAEAPVQQASETPVPTPAPDPAQTQIASADGVMEAKPMLDTQGIAPVPFSGGTDAPAPPSESGVAASDNEAQPR